MPLFQVSHKTWDSAVALWGLRFHFSSQVLHDLMTFSVLKYVLNSLRIPEVWLCKPFEEKYISCTDIVICGPFCWYILYSHPLFVNLDYEGFQNTKVKKDWILDGSLALQKVRYRYQVFFVGWKKIGTSLELLMKNIRVVFGTCW